MFFCIPRDESDFSTSAMKRHMSLPRERRKPSMEQFIRRYREGHGKDIEDCNRSVFIPSFGSRKVSGRRPVERPEEVINKELREMYEREKEHRRMIMENKMTVL